MILWETIYKHLSEHGFDVYSPGQHKGDCLSPYIVIKPAGATQFGEYSSDIVYYDLMVYVPQDKFSLLSLEVDRLKATMKLLYPMIRESHVETPAFSDDTNKSHMWSIQYHSYRKFYNTKM